MKSKYIFILSALAGLSFPAMAQLDSAYVDFVEQTLEVGADKAFSREISTASVSVIPNQDFDRRSAKNIGNALLGNGKGLITLQNSGTTWAQNPTMYVRGLQTLSDNTPLFIIDGIERNIDMVDPEEVLEVQILKDAAATALYGYKGANGVVYIKTKRGEYNSKTIRFSYEHTFMNMTNKPRFVNGLTYANAMNEALRNEGQGPRYDENAIAAFTNGTYPQYYPSVNWVDEVFRNHASGNHATIEFSGGGQRFRYMTMGTLFISDGFIKNPNENKGYSTQDKYVRGNIRTNLDIDLTPTTMLHTNVFASLSEKSQPGNQADLWSLVHTVPSAAFPIHGNELGAWGGNSTWAGTSNPVAQATGAAYYKLHERALYFDGQLEQDLSMVVPGLSFQIGASYDTYSDLYENHSKEFLYGSYAPVWDGTQYVNGDWFEGGKQGEMGTAAGTSNYQRRFTVNTGFDYNHSFGKNDLYAQLKYFYDFQETTGVNTKIYRRNYSFMAQYAYDKKFLLGVTLVESGSSRLAPGTKWAFSPTVSAGYVIANNKDASALNFLKIRASWGILNVDNLPGDNVWTYYLQSYTASGGSYPYGSGYDSTQGSTTLGQMAAVNPTHEKARKLNVGFDATLVQGLDIQFDYFNNHRYDIWVSGAGAYSALIGFSAPYTNDGVVDEHGIDFNVNYLKSFGDFTINLGGSFLWTKSKIVNMGEEPRAYENLKQTGNPLNSIYGLKAMGLFTSQEEIDAAPKQSFSTVRPGDIRYEDVNGDGVIDANDATKIGYSTACPEIYYTFNLGAEYKGFGLQAQFQGTAHYSALLNTSGYYWGLINNTSLAQEVYDGRWTAENNNANALYPRLSSTSNANNYQTSTYWLRDRSFLKLRNIELYYNLPSSLLAKTGFIKGTRVYVRGVDLFSSDHIDNKDPEALGQITPLSRNIIIGAKLTF